MVAWIGAIRGVGGFAWDFYKWKTAGPKLSVSVQTDMVLLEQHGRPLGDDKFVDVRIQNNGTVATTITTLAFCTFESLWRRKRLKRSRCGVVLQPQTAFPLPHKLGIGEEWHGMVIQKGRFEEMRSTGKLWCEVCHSWSKRSVLARIPPATR